MFGLIQTISFFSPLKKIKIALCNNLITVNVSTKFHVSRFKI